jgi:hypothetical protein
MTGHDLVIVHTMVGYLWSTDSMFRAGGYTGVEATYGLGGKWGPDADHHLDGVLWQWQERDHQADANLDANPRAISIETADNAPKLAADIARWTDAQAATLVDLIAWECSPAAHEHCPTSWTCHGRGIPAELVPDSRRSRRGVAYHRQGIDPWRVAGAEVWSTKHGKECPGDRRIHQLTTEILPAVQARLRGDDMTKAELLALLKDHDVRAALADAVLSSDSIPNRNGTETNPTITPRTILSQTEDDLDKLKAWRTEDRAALDRIDTAVAKLAVGGIDLEALARAVNDDAARRLQQ